jgi:glycosyltransferase involved in cell wall biosynthesis
MRTELGLGDSFVVGHIGRCDIPQKNHKFLIKVFSEIAKIKPESVLLLIGAEEDEEIVEMDPSYDEKRKTNIRTNR